MSQMMFMMMMGMQMMSMLMMVARWRQEWRCSLPIILYIFRQIQMLFLPANRFALIQSFTGPCFVLPCAKLESPHGSNGFGYSCRTCASSFSCDSTCPPACTCHMMYDIFAPHKQPRSPSGNQVSKIQRTLRTPHATLLPLCFSARERSLGLLAMWGNVMRMRMGWEEQDDVVCLP